MGNRGGSAGIIVRRVAWVMAAALPVVGALANGTHLLVHASGTADMSVGISAPSTVQWGEYFTYSVEISNTGPETATGVVVTVNLPTDVAYRGSGSPSCSAAGQRVTWTFSSWGANTAGAFSISGQAMAIGTAVIQATITANESDPTLLDNTTSVTTTITPSTTADLLATISGERGADRKGGQVGRDEAGHPRLIAHSLPPDDREIQDVDRGHQDRHDEA